MFDFQIADRNQEIVIRSFNGMNRVYLSSFLFAWKDVKKHREQLTRKRVVGLAIVNDEDKSVPEEYINALGKEETDHILWSGRYEPANVGKLKEAA